MPHLVALSLGFLGIHGCTGPIPTKNSVLREGLSKNSDLDLKRELINNLHAPQASLALTSGAPYCSQPGLSRHIWVHDANSRQKLVVAGEMIQNIHSVTRTKDFTLHAHKYMYTYIDVHMYIYMRIYVQSLVRVTTE